MSRLKYKERNWGFVLGLVFTDQLYLLLMGLFPHWDSFQLTFWKLWPACDLGVVSRLSSHPTAPA